MSGFKRANPSNLQAQLEALNNKSSFEKQKENEWKLNTDAAGNGQAVIRFLPAIPTDPNAVPFVKLYTHGFKLKNGQWFIENCPTTIGLDCPICEFNQPLWQGTEEDKARAGAQKRKTNYYANILIIKDPTNPENNGQIKVFRFGQKIMDKIIAQSQGDPDLGTPPQDVTCVFTGSNFVLKAKKVAGFPNYDDSKFAGPSEIENINDEVYANELISKMHKISDYVSPDKFKSYEELQKKLFEKMGKGQPRNASAELTESVSGNSVDDALAQYESQTVVNAQKAGTGTVMTDDELEALLAS